MSEVENTKTRGENFRRNLLANVSMLALLGYFGVSQAALADTSDEDRPPLWIELGGQFERMGSANEFFTPAFLDKTPTADRVPMIAAQAPSPVSIGGEGKISFEPEGTGWVLSAAIVYGRSSTTRHDHRQTPNPYIKQYFGTAIYSPPGHEVFGDGQADSKASHAILDFRAGKDVGLGMFGAGAKSVISAGVRFAQFISNSGVALNARPDYKFGNAYSGHRYSTYFHRSIGYRLVNDYRHTYAASLHTRRNAHAVGPSLSWDVSLPVAGTDKGMTLAADWGLNASVLFGRQHAHVDHQTSGQYHAKVGRHFKYPYQHYIHSSYVRAPFDQDRTRAVTIPNIGGFAGITFKKSITKISLGYKADFFFNAMDEGVDTRKSSTLGFYGPFATVSIGLGG
jgi:hypothetical protein